MNDSQASSCAWRELKSCSSPSSEDFRAYIAHRSVFGLAGSILVLLSRPQAEEQWPRPARPRDVARDLRERFKVFSLEREPIFEHRDLMLGAVPLADQHGSRLSRTPRPQLCCPVFAGTSRPALQKSPGGWLQAAKSFLLNTIGKRLNDERTAQPRRHRRPVQLAPPLCQLIRIQRAEAIQFVL